MVSLGHIVSRHIFKTNDIVVFEEILKFLRKYLVCAIRTFQDKIEISLLIIESDTEYSD